MRTHQAVPPRHVGLLPRPQKRDHTPGSRYPSRQHLHPGLPTRSLEPGGALPDVQAAARVPSAEALLLPGDACASTRRQTVPDVLVCHFRGLC